MYEVYNVVFQTYRERVRLIIRSFWNSTWHFVGVSLCDICPMASAVASDDADTAVVSRKFGSHLYWYSPTGTGPHQRRHIIYWRWKKGARFEDELVEFTGTVEQAEKELDILNHYLWGKKRTSRIEPELVFWPGDGETKVGEYRVYLCASSHDQSGRIDWVRCVARGSGTLAEAKAHASIFHRPKDDDDYVSRTSSEAPLRKYTGF
jgi:hypothetical protein